jgi:hypothetical protein
VKYQNLIRHLLVFALIGAPIACTSSGEEKTMDEPEVTSEEGAVEEAAPAEKKMKEKGKKKGNKKKGKKGLKKKKPVAPAEEVDQSASLQGASSSYPLIQTPPVVPNRPPENGVPGYTVGNHVFVKTAGLNGRLGPGSQHEIATVYEKGERLIVWESQQQWIKVGDEIWVSKEGLDTKSPSS